MKKATKKCILTGCILALACAAAFFAYKQINLYLFEQAGIWGKCIANEDFDACYGDFVAIAQVAERYTDQAEKTGNRSMLVGYDRQSTNYHLDYLTSGQSERVALSEGEQRSLNRVIQAFINKDAQLNDLRIFKNRISFETNNGLYTLVYSTDNAKPAFLNLPDKKEKFYVRKIRENWYHVVKNPG